MGNSLAGHGIGVLKWRLHALGLPLAVASLLLAVRSAMTG
jgi:hypothetical protein